MIKKYIDKGKSFFNEKYYSIYKSLTGDHKEIILNERYISVEEASKIFNKLKYYIYFDYVKGPKWKSRSFNRVNNTISFEEFLKYYRIKVR